MIPLVGKVFASLTVFGLVALLGRLIGNGGGTQRVADGARVLGYGRDLRGLAVLGGVLIPLCVVVFGWLSPPRDASEWWSWGGLIVGFGLMGGYLMLEGFQTKVVLTTDGITKFHWWYPPRFVAWEDVERIDPRLRSWGDYAVRTRTGTPLGVPGPQFFGPAEWFREACLEHLWPDQYPEVFRK